MSQIKAIHTNCKNCVFAVYNINTQTGCHLDYLNKYKNIGSEILEVYDENKEFYVINDKKCLGYRENSWFNQFDLAHATLEDKIAKFKELNHISYCVGIDLRNIKTINQLELIIEEINNSNILPKKIVVFRFPKHAKTFSYDNVRSVLSKVSKSIKWRIQSMLDQEEPEESIVYNFSVNNKSYRFLMYINNYTSSIPGIIKKANSLVYDNLQFFNAVSDKNKQAYVFSGGLYRYALIEQKKNILNNFSEFIIVE
jgi:hypothetical protein